MLIRWDTDFFSVLPMAKETGRPVFQDFWFDG